jgi:hypothetical protein
MSFLNKEGENHPYSIGIVNIDQKNKLVNTNKIDSSTFAKAKRFGDVIDFEYELNLLLY